MPGYSYVDESPKGGGYSFVDEPDQPDPTEGMSTTDKLLAGVGRNIVEFGRGIGQRLREGIEFVAPPQKSITDLVTGGKGRSFADTLGLPTQADIDEARKLDAPLMNTAAGKVGGFIGSAVPALGVMLIPGAQGLAGSIAIGGGLGAARPTTTGESAIKNAALGAGLGAAGYGAGKLIGTGIGKLADRAADRAAANSAAIDAAAAARDAGYVIPPTQTNPSLTNRLLEGFAGKVATAQNASARNQQVTDNLIKRELGLPDNTQLSLDVLDAVRSDAGKAYGAISKLGNFDAAGANLPASVGVKNFTDPLTLTRKSTVDAGELVRAWKQSNHDATAYYRAYARDANPETLAKAKAASDAAKQIDGFLTDTLNAAGKSDMVQALKDARVLIAKSYTAEKGLNPATGTIDARILAGEIKKGKPLSGGFKQAGDFAGMFPKAAQTPEKMGSLPQISPLDFNVGALGTAAGAPSAFLLGPGRMLARSMILSRPYQGLMGAPSQGLLGGLLTQQNTPAVAGLLSRGGGLLGATAGPGLLNFP